MEVLKVFSKEEFHRGEWQQMFTLDKNGDKKPFTVRITEHHAERMNAHKDDYRMRYVLKHAEEKTHNPDVSALRDEYESLKGKKAYGGWNAEKLSEKIAELKEPKE